VIADVTARTAALTAGTVHWISRADLKTLNLLKRDPNVNIDEVTGLGHYTFPMHVDTAPFDNVDVRTALKYAVNRQDIVDKVFLGHGAPGNDNPIAPSVKFAIDPEPKFTYDPEKAKFHLKKAGMETLKVDLSNEPTGRTVKRYANHQRSAILNPSPSQLPAILLCASFLDDAST